MTTSGGRITGKHVKSVVARRLQVVSDEKPVPQQSLQTSPSSYEIGQLVLIHCEDSAASKRCRQYSGCWAVVHHVFEAAAVVAVGGEMVRYLFCDLQPIENASPVLKEVWCGSWSISQVAGKNPKNEKLPGNNFLNSYIHAGESPASLSP